VVTGRTAAPGREADHAPAIPPPWLVWSSWVLTLIALASAAYLTFEHYSSSTSFACPHNATLNCVKVTTSSYSRFLGVPVAVGGLAFFVVMAVACSPWAWRLTDPRLVLARIAATGLGVVSVIYLVWAELFRIDAICLYCTVIHVCTVLLFGVLVLGQAFRPVEDGYEDEDELVR
jgi:uncharacterized membrane protein